MIRKAIGRKLGADAEDVMKVLNERGITMKFANTGNKPGFVAGGRLLNWRVPSTLLSAGQ